MKIKESFLEEFNAIAKSQNFIFDENDLKILFNINELNQSFYRTYTKLFSLGLVKRFCRGIYVSKGFNLLDLNKKINEDSYISFDYILAKNALIGTFSDKKISSVIQSGRTKKISQFGFSIEQYKICKSLFFGFTNVDGYKMATKEKAYLDCLYFYTKGLKFSFDIFSDIDISMLDYLLILKYLKKYKNKKFQTFVLGVLKND